MRNILMQSALAGILAVTSMPATYVSLASAQGVELRIDRNGVRMRDRDRCDPDEEDCGPPPPPPRDRDMRQGRDRGPPPDFDDDYRDRSRYEDRGCTPDRALWKASRMGLRNPRVVDMDRRTIDVRGRDRYGDRTTITFGRRDRSCPVL